MFTHRKKRKKGPCSRSRPLMLAGKNHLRRLGSKRGDRTGRGRKKVGGGGVTKKGGELGSGRE